MEIALVPTRVNCSSENACKTGKLENAKMALSMVDSPLPPLRTWPIKMVILIALTWPIGIAVSSIPRKERDSKYLTAETLPLPTYVDLSLRLLAWFHTFGVTPARGLNPCERSYPRNSQDLFLQAWSYVFSLQRYKVIALFILFPYKIVSPLRKLRSSLFSRAISRFLTI